MQVYIVYFKTEALTSRSTGLSASGKTPNFMYVNGFFVCFIKPRDDWVTKLVMPCDVQYLAILMTLTLKDLPNNKRKLDAWNDMDFYLLHKLWRRWKYFKSQA